MPKSLEIDDHVGAVENIAKNKSENYESSSQGHLNNSFENMSIDWYIIQPFSINSDNLVNAMTLTLKEFNILSPESKLKPGGSWH